MRETILYTRNRPHIQPWERAVFITDRLYGSIPKQTLAIWQEEYELALRKIKLSPELQTEEIEQELYVLRARLFGKQDEYLDKNRNEPYHLKQPNIAKLVMDAFAFQDGKQYTLYTLTLMGNHLHYVLSLQPDAPPLYHVIGQIKRFTGNRALRILGKPIGSHFWEPEPYDHVVRTGRFDRVINYTLQNPVKAGFVQHWRDWEFTYLHPDLQDYY